MRLTPLVARCFPAARAAPSVAKAADEIRFQADFRWRVLPDIEAWIAAGDDPAQLRDGLNLILGAAWDAELEPFRRAGDGVPVRWLHQVV